MRESRVVWAVVVVILVVLAAAAWTLKSTSGDLESATEQPVDRSSQLDSLLDDSGTR